MTRRGASKTLARAISGRLWMAIDELLPDRATLMVFRLVSKLARRFFPELVRMETGKVAGIRCDCEVAALSLRRASAVLGGGDAVDEIAWLASTEDLCWSMRMRSATAAQTTIEANASTSNVGRLGRLAAAADRSFFARSTEGEMFATNESAFFDCLRTSASEGFGFLCCSPTIVRAL